MSPKEQNQIPLRPSDEIIEICAYLIWEKEGRPEGYDKIHWEQAEEQLTLVNAHNIVTATTLSGAPALSEIERRQN